MENLRPGHLTATNVLAYYEEQTLLWHYMFYNTGPFILQRKNVLYPFQRTRINRLLNNLIFNFFLFLI
jgi:hypothetical protein